MNPENRQPQATTIPQPQSKQPTQPIKDPKKQHIPPTEPDIQPDYYKFEPCAMKRMSARALSEET